MTATLTLDDPQTAKANMDEIYVQPDPRAYFRTLHALGYVIPDLAKPVFQTLSRAIAAERGRPVNILDIGCSYGVNAALLKHDLSMSMLHRHWTDPDLADADPATLVDIDRAYFSGLETVNPVNMIGLDQSVEAVGFGAATGLLDTGLALNLEEQALPADAAASVAGVDLVISTGCVGYVGAPTFDRLIPAVGGEGGSPWMANFVLRMFSFDPIEASLSDAGYVTEKLEGRSFVQRNFASDDERRAVLDRLDALGIDPTDMETDGQLHAELYLSRPAGDTALPLDRLAA